jgi:hypothetical protein
LTVFQQGRQYEQHLGGGVSKIFHWDCIMQLKRFARGLKRENMFERNDRVNVSGDFFFEQLMDFSSDLKTEGM